MARAAPEPAPSPAPEPDMGEAGAVLEEAEGAPREPKARPKKARRRRLRPGASAESAQDAGGAAAASEVRGAAEEPPPGATAIAPDSEGACGGRRKRKRTRTAADDSGRRPRGGLTRFCHRALVEEAAARGIPTEGSLRLRLIADIREHDAKVLRELVEEATSTGGGSTRSNLSPGVVAELREHGAGIKHMTFKDIIQEAQARGMSTKSGRKSWDQLLEEICESRRKDFHKPCAEELTKGSAAIPEWTTPQTLSRDEIEALHDAPEGHVAHLAVRIKDNNGKPNSVCKFMRPGKHQYFVTGVLRVADKEEALRIGRLCYMLDEAGASLEAIMEFRTRRMLRLAPARSRSPRGGPPAAQQSLEPDASEQEARRARRFTVGVVRESPLDRLGFTVTHAVPMISWREQRRQGSLKVVSLSEEGLVPQWNAARPPAERVRPGDLLVRVDGAEKPPGMMKALRRTEGWLELRFERQLEDPSDVEPPARSPAGRRAPGEEDGAEDRPGRPRRARSRGPSTERLSAEEAAGGVQEAGAAEQVEEAQDEPAELEEEQEELASGEEDEDEEEVDEILRELERGGEGAREAAGGQAAGGEGRGAVPEEAHEGRGPGRGKRRSVVLDIDELSGAASAAAPSDADDDDDDDDDAAAAPADGAAAAAAGAAASGAAASGAAASGAAEGGLAAADAELQEFRRGIVAAAAAEVGEFQAGLLEPCGDAEERERLEEQLSREQLLRLRAERSLADLRRRQARQARELRRARALISSAASAACPASDASAAEEPGDGSAPPPPPPPPPPAAPPARRARRRRARGAAAGGAGRGAASRAAASGAAGARAARAPAGDGADAGSGADAGGDACASSGEWA